LTRNSLLKPARISSIMQLRGVRIARGGGQIRRLDVRRYMVRSQSKPIWYNVTWCKSFWRCDCPFNTKTRQTCKHIYAVLNRISETETDPPARFDAEPCPSCGHHEPVVRRGYYKSRSGLVQRYQCKRCGVKFTARTGFTGMKYNASLITAALDLYFKGLSLRSITDHLNQIHALHISHLTVYRWVKKYVRLTGRFARRLRPRLSKTWHADEMKIRVDGKPRNLWNLMDHKTRYLVAVQITKRKGTKEAERLLTNSLRKTGLHHLDVISDGLSSYDRAIEHMRKKNSLPKIRHHTDVGLSKRKSNNRLERLNGTTRERLKTMRGLDNDKSSRKFTEGYATYYNLIRPHSALQGKTPGQAAKTWRPKNTNRWHSLIKASLEGIRERRNELSDS